MNRPNIVFILTDDQGWQDLGSFGHPYLKTPNLDRLAERGTAFMNYYVSSPVCSPSRSTFLTGHYPARHNIHHIFWNGDEAGLQRMRDTGVPHWHDPRKSTLPRALKHAGYRTGHFGKWHLGNVPDAPNPEVYGFDRFRGNICATRWETWPDGCASSSPVPRTRMNR